MTDTDALTHQILAQIARAQAAVGHYRFAFHAMPERERRLKAHVLNLLRIEGRVELFPEPGRPTVWKAKTTPAGRDWLAAFEWQAGQQTEEQKGQKREQRGEVER